MKQKENIQPNENHRRQHARLTGSRNSCGPPVVILEKTAEALAALDRPEEQWRAEIPRLSAPCAAEFHRLRLSDRQPPLNAILFTSHSFLGSSPQRYESNSGASIVTGHRTLGLRPLAKTRVKGNNSRNFRNRSDLWIVSAPGARDRWSSGGPAEET